MNPKDIIKDPCIDCENKEIDSYGYVCNWWCGERTAYFNKLAGGLIMLEALNKKAVKEAK